LAEQSAALFKPRPRCGFGGLTQARLTIGGKLAVAPQSAAA
jgi:hypothetical protein